MALEIKVRAVPDTSKFKQELDAAIGNLKPIKIPVGIDIDSESKRILDQLNSYQGKGLAKNTSSTRSSAAETKQLKDQLAIQKQLSALARQYDNMNSKQGFNSTNLNNLGKYLNQFRTASGDFQVSEKSIDAFNKGLQEAKANAQSAAAEYSKFASVAKTAAQSQAATGQAAAQQSQELKKAVSLQNQLNTAYTRYNNALQLQRRGFESSSLGDATKGIQEFLDKDGLLKKFDDTSILQYESAIQDVSKAFRQVNVEATAWSRNQSVTRTINSQATAIRNLSREISDYMNANPNLVNNRVGFKELQKLYSDVTTGQIDAGAARKQYASIRAEMQSMGLEAESLGQRVSKLFGDHFNTAVALLGVNALQNGLQQLWQSVKDVDSAMTEMAKVSDLTGRSLNSFLESAGQRAINLGATLSDTIMATADAVKLGYDTQQAEILSDAAITYLTVGDNVGSVENASASLISTMKAFRIEAEDSMRIVDEFNTVGNEFSIGSADIGEALQRSASALEFGNNTLEESIGLITSGFDIVQNAEVMGTALKTLSMNLRGAKADLEAAGEDTEGMANSTAELRDALLTLTGVDIMVNEDTFKSTFQILQEISEVWGSMADIDQAAALELMAGKRQANILSAIISNFDTAVEARDAALESTGSAVHEQGIYLDSVNGKLAQFTASFQTLSTSVLDSGLVKYFLDLATAATQLADSLTNTLGGPGWLVGGALGLFSNYYDAGILRLIDDPETLSGKRLEIVKNIFGGASKTERSQIEFYNKTLSEVSSGVEGASKKMSDFKKSIENTRLGEWIGQLNDAPAELDAFNKSLSGTGIAAKAASVGMKVLSAAGNAAIGILIGTAVNLAINGLTWLAETEDRLLEKAQEATETYKSNSSSLEDYRARVQTLNEQLSSGTLSYDETVTARQELLSIQQAMIEQFGAEADAASLVTQAVQGQASAWDDLQKSQLDQWKLEVSEQNWLGNTPFDEAIKKMSQTTGANIKDIYSFLNEGISSRTPLIRSGMYDAFNEFVDDYPELFDFGGGSTVVGPSAFEWDSIDIEELRDNYLAHVRETFTGKVTGNELRKIENAASSQFSDLMSQLDKKVQNTVSEWGETAETAGLYEILNDDTLSKLYEDLYIAQNEYTEALASGEDVDVDSAANSLRDSVAAIRAVIDSDDTPEYVADYFRGMLEGIGPQINEWDFEDAIESKFSSAFKNLDLDANDIYEALLGDGTDAVDQKIRDLIQNVAEVASETDIIPELIDGQDIPVESLEKLLDVLIELGYVEGATSNATQELANSFASVSESVQAAISEVETVNEVLSAQGTGTGVTLENFEALIAANKEYADALEYNNGVMKINAERAREIADQDVSASIAEASTEMKVQASTLRDTQDALLGYKEQLAKLYRDQERGIEVSDAQIASLERTISSYEKQSDALQLNIEKYSILISQLRESTSPYALWQQAQEAPESGDMYDTLFSALEDVEEGLTSGKIGRNDYQTAVDLLIPTDVSAEGEARIQEYKNNVLSRFMTMDGENNVTAWGAQNFIDSAYQSGLLGMDESGNYFVQEGVVLDDFTEKLNITRDVARALFGELEEYGWEFDWGDEFEQSMELTEEEIENYKDKINKTISEIGSDPIDIKANLSELTQAEADLFDLNNLDIATQTVDWPVEVKARLQLVDQVEDQEALVEQLKAKLSQLEQDYQNGEVEYGVVLSARTDLAEAEQELALLQVQLDLLGVPTEVQLELVTADIDAEIARLQEKLNTLEVGSVEYETVESQIDQLNQKKVQIESDLNTSVFDKNAKEVKGTLNDLDSEVVQPTVRLNGYYTVKSQLNDIISTIYGIPTSRTFTLYNNTVNRVTTIAGHSNAGLTFSPRALGSAQTDSGDAYVSGDWGISKRQRALVGELGRELVVDPFTGKWRTVGDFGPEMADLPKGAIIFNHAQTEDILKKGRTSGRGVALASGSAYASGTAYVSGGGSGLPVQVGTGQSSWNSGYNNNANKVVQSNNKVTQSNNQVAQSNNKVAQSNNQVAQSNQKVEETSKSATDAVEEFVSELWELYEVETALNDIRVKSEYWQTQLDLSTSPNDRIGIRETMVDTYREEQDALHDLAEARRDLIEQDLAELSEKGFIFDYDPAYNKLLIKNTEHINDLVGEVSGTFETNEERENALQEATNDLRQETEDLINSVIDMNEANQEASQSWWELEQDIRNAKEEIANESLGIFDEFVSFMDSFELWGSSAEDRVDVLIKKQDELNRLWEQGYLTIEQYRELTNSNQVEIYEERRDAIKDIIELTEEMIRQEVEDHIDALEKQIDAYREIIDLRKEALKAGKDEEDHQSELAEKLEEMARLRQRIDRLTLAANSGDRAAAAEKIALEEDYADLQRELQDFQSDYVYNAQVEAIDKELEDFENAKNEEIEIAQASIDTQLKLYQAAINRINQGWDALFDDLEDYTYTYQDAIDGPDSLKTAWEIATDAVKDYAYNVEAALEGIKGEGTLGNVSADRINSIVNQMRENSQKWHTATTKAEKQQYVAANERLAQQLSAEIGRKVVKGYDGNWYLDKVGGQMLFDVYPGTTNADKINPLIDQMKENSRLWYSVDTKEERQQYIDANEQIAKQISALVGRPVVKGQDGYWYLDHVGGAKLYDVWGGTSSVPAPPTVDDAQQNNQTEVQVRSLVRDMRNNSTKWDNATDADERAYYKAKNNEIAQQISDLLKRPVLMGSDGVWYLDRIGGRKLYDVYHKGGIVGDVGTLHDNEVFSVLEKGEFVLSDSQKKTLYDLVGMAKILGDPSDRLVSSKTSIYDGMTGDTFNASFDIDFNGVGTLDESSVKKYGDMFANYTIKKLQSGFAKSGISPVKAPFSKP